MKKIKVTIIAAAKEDYPGCADILGSCPEIEIVARPTGLLETGVWSAISSSDVLVLDEAALAQDGTTAVRALHQYYPLVRLLLVLDNSNENIILEAIAMGFSGIIERASLRSMVRRAIPALYTGEAWVSRRLLPKLRTELLRQDCDSLTGMLIQTPGIGGKLN